MWSNRYEEAAAEYRTAGQTAREKAAVETGVQPMEGGCVVLRPSAEAA